LWKKSCLVTLCCNVTADSLASIGLTKCKIKDFNLASNKAVLKTKGKKYHLIITVIYKKYLVQPKCTNISQTNMAGTIPLSNESDGNYMGLHLARKKNIYSKVYTWSNGLCNVRENMYYSYWSPVCLVCNNEKEAICRILKCSKCIKRELVRKKYGNRFKQQINITGTNTDTTQVIVMRVKSGY
jgi:hypothetical protein